MPSRAGKMKAGVRIPRHAWGVRPYRPSSSKGSTAANLSLILGIVSVIVWLALGTPGDIHVAIIGLPMAAIGYILGTVFGKKPTPEQLEVVRTSQVQARAQAAEN